MNYTFQFGVAFESLPFLLKASVLTVELSFLAFWGGALIGLAGAAAKTFGGPVASRIAQGYVVFFTNTPALLQIYVLYYGLPEDVSVILPGQKPRQIFKVNAMPIPAGTRVLVKTGGGGGWGIPQEKGAG